MLPHSGPLQPSIFIVGDRKQSIYGFRDADVSVLQEAGRHLEALRPGRRRAPLDLAQLPLGPAAARVRQRRVPRHGEGAARAATRSATTKRIAFRSTSPRPSSWGACLGAVLADTPEACAEITAHEIARLIEAGTTIRDRDTGVRRPVRAGDIAILFRTRESHREFEDALERRGIRAYVYKGLGFFDADEIKDVLALLWYLADPLSDLRAAAFMRSRFARISDEALRRLAPRLADALAIARRRRRRRPHWTTPMPGGAGAGTCRHAAVARARRSAAAGGAARPRSSTSPRTRSSCAGRDSSRRART